MKNDGKLVDLIVQKVYDYMMAFDPERSETVIELMIRRRKMAEDAFEMLSRTCENLARPHITGFRLYGGRS